MKSNIEEQKKQQIGRKLPPSRALKDPKFEAKKIPVARNQGIIKSVQKNHTASEKASKDSVENKPQVPSPRVNPAAGGHYELNPLMTRMVEAELQDIMIKVWQELPDNPPNEAEKLVADKLKNKAGDDLRNVLGLNVAKRLLNVFNPLYVKVNFEAEPERTCLPGFIKKCNFAGFKRSEKSGSNAYVALLKNVKDFDWICTSRGISCGKVKATISPYYKFTKCPLNLRTSFDDINTDVTDKNVASEKSEVDAKTAKVQVKAVDEESAGPDNAVKQTASTTKPEAKPLKSQDVIAKEKPKVTNAAAKENTKENKSAPKVVEEKNRNVKKAEKTLETKQKGTKNVAQIKQSPKLKMNEKKAPNKSVQQKGNDFDELDDHDILALISGGVVLDECSGSDDE